MDQYFIFKTVLLVAACFLCVTSIPPGGEPDNHCAKPYVSEEKGFVKLLNDGIAAVVQCYDGYAVKYEQFLGKKVEMFCYKGYWVTQTGERLSDMGGRPYVTCEASCGNAPYVENAQTGNGGGYGTYSCNHGYTLLNSDHSALYCENGEWVGVKPTCVRSCSEPEVISNGIFTGYTADGERLTSYKTKYQVGYHVKYSCNYGYYPAGNTVMTCEDYGWSGSPPTCTSKDSGDWTTDTTCHALSKNLSGHCFCDTKTDLTQCEPFHIGDHIECVCNNGFKLVGEAILTCRPSGSWDYDMPACIEEEEAIDTQSHSSKGSSNSAHMSTLAIVVATACSVLGVLLLIMVIMIFRRRKPRPPSRLCRPSATPPPYSRVHNNSIDELDRYLLIGYENPNEAPRVNLPSYEEAMASSQNQIGHRQGHIPRSVEGQSHVGEYRPLPSIPGTFRANQMISGENTSRHSIITTSTMNRDGVSEIFGSIDTVNVSVSDASTAVTIETLDSATSHHSNMSRRATAGSIASANSNESLVTEDAPLLESIQREENDKSDEDGDGTNGDE